MHLLKNKNLEISIDPPLGMYRGSRFDWTGKIAAVRFQGIPLTTRERNTRIGGAGFGQGLYNEFGIDAALGFEEAADGGWFHKIGVGLLKKEGTHYQFNRKYPVEPARFDIEVHSDNARIRCISQIANGYAYALTKTITCGEGGFRIGYQLENRGDKPINTTEYAHNFLAVNQEPVGPGYILKFPFPLKPESFGETVNPEGKVDLSKDRITFGGNPKEPFFFSNLSGGEQVVAGWELTHLKSRLSISEQSSFRTNRINLWGWGHVISPELFHFISLEPGESVEWARFYAVKRL